MFCNQNICKKDRGGRLSTFVNMHQFSQHSLHNRHTLNFTMILGSRCRCLPPKYFKISFDDNLPTWLPAKSFGAVQRPRRKIVKPEWKRGEN